jgi:ribosome-binding protein aMBF1 (putative translation factor)
LAATMYNACEIAGEDVRDEAQAIRVSTALKVIEDCKGIIKERIREQGINGTMANALRNAQEIVYAPTRD